MTYKMNTGRPPYVPAAQGGLSDPRSTGSVPQSAAPRQMLTDRRSTR
jgi:hypothetical protein